MNTSHLESALHSIDWNSLVNEFLSHPSLPNTVSMCNTRLAIWSQQLEIVDKENPALSFVREMQASGHQVAALTSLALYKPAASAIRTVVETAFYYTYFRTHLKELTTLVRNDEYFVQKNDIVDFHKLHTENFIEFQKCFDLVAHQKKWYSQVSSIVHGQIPGVWITHQSLANIKHVDANLEAVVKTFKEGEEIVHHLFLCTVGAELWDGFSTPAKHSLIAVLSGTTKTILGLDSA
jgi:hypothetical protein